jgi:prepilin-type N-terminal cleavage/methylation domain-containing protein
MKPGPNHRTGSPVRRARGGDDPGRPLARPVEAAATRNRQTRRGFTLIEIMVVAGIIAVIMTVSIPAIYRHFHPDSIIKATREIMDICRDARARAILNCEETILVLRIKDRRIDIVSGGKPASASALAEEIDAPQPVAKPASQGTSSSYALSDYLTFEEVGINGETWSEDDEAYVRFKPNGTCDAMSIVLLSAKSERRNIFLDEATGMVDFEVDPQKFHKQ